MLRSYSFCFLTLIAALIIAQSAEAQKRRKDRPPAYEDPAIAFPVDARIRSVAVRGDGDVLAVGMEAPSIPLFEAATGKLVQTLIGHKDFVTRVTFSSDGKLLASASLDNTVRVWDLATGKARLTLPIFVARDSEAVSATRSIAFSPDDKLLMVCSSSGAGLWSVANGKLKTRFGGEPQRHPAFPGVSEPSNTWGAVFAPDGKQMVSINSTYASSAYILVWREGATGRLTKPRAIVGEIGYSIQGKRTSPPSASFSSDGSLLAVTYPLRVFDLVAKAEIGKFDHEWGQALGFIHGNKRLLVTEGPGTPSSAVLFDLATSKVDAHVIFKGGNADAIALSADSRRFVAGTGSSVEVWEMDKLK